jgi:hypothetical protein
MILKGHRWDHPAGAMRDFVRGEVERVTLFGQPNVNPVRTFEKKNSTTTCGLNLIMKT